MNPLAAVLWDKAQDTLHAARLLASTFRGLFDS